MNRKVDEYIEKQKSPQKEICSKLRKIIMKTFPGIKEEFRMGVPWYECKYYIVALKDHVNIGFSVKGMSQKDMDLLEGQGKIMRHLKFFFPVEIDEKKVTKLLKMVKGHDKHNDKCCSY